MDVCVVLNNLTGKFLCCFVVNILIGQNSRVYLMVILNDSIEHEQQQQQAAQYFVVERTVYYVRHSALNSGTLVSFATALTLNAASFSMSIISLYVYTGLR